MSYDKQQIVEAIKHSETGFLTTKQKRTNLEILLCCMRTESILAKIDNRDPLPCFICSQEEEKSHIYHILATCPLVYGVWPLVFHFMLRCTGRFLTINDDLIFNNKVKATEWRGFSKDEKKTALTLVSAGRNTLYKMYYIRSSGFPSDQERLVHDIFQNEVDACKKIASYSDTKDWKNSSILRAPVTHQRLGYPLEKRLRDYRRKQFLKNKDNEQEDSASEVDDYEDEANPVSEAAAVHLPRYDSLPQYTSV